jgi:hypothetical protein
MLRHLFRKPHVIVSQTFRCNTHLNKTNIRSTEFIINPKKIDHELDKILVGHQYRYSDHQRTEILINLPEWTNNLSLFIKDKTQFSKDEIQSARNSISNFLYKILPVINNVKDVRQVAKLIEIAMFYKYG